MRSKSLPGGQAAPLLLVQGQQGHFQVSPHTFWCLLETLKKRWKVEISSGVTTLSIWTTARPRGQRVRSNHTHGIAFSQAHLSFFVDLIYDAAVGVCMVCSVAHLMCLVVCRACVRQRASFVGVWS